MKMMMMIRMMVMMMVMLVMLVMMMMVMLTFKLFAPCTHALDPSTAKIIPNLPAYKPKLAKVAKLALFVSK